MAFVEYVPGLRSKYHPEIADNLKIVRETWSSAQDDASERLSTMLDIVSLRMPDYCLTDIDLLCIKEGLGYELAHADIKRWYTGKRAETINRGMEQRYLTSQERLRGYLSTESEPISFDSIRQTAYLNQASYAAKAITSLYNEAGDYKNLINISTAVAPHIHNMRLLREGAPVNVSNLF